MTKNTHGGHREGSGRKQLLKTPRIVSIALDQSDLDRLDRWRQQRELSRSEAVRRLIRRVR